MAIKISFGINNDANKPVSDYPTAGHVLQDANLKQFLGFGNNVEARINGTTAPDNQVLVDGDTIELVTRANKKG